MTLPPPPVLNPPNTTTPPSLPEKWHATALLTPFGGEPVAADVWYDWTLQAMQITLCGVTEGYADLLLVQDALYLIVTDDGQVTFYGPVPLEVSVPPPGWLGALGLTCRGTQSVLGTNCSWWVGVTTCTNPVAPQDPPAPTDQVANWIWLRADTGMPWRMMGINMDNPLRMPILGSFGMVHFATFEPVSATPLPALMQARAAGPGGTLAGAGAGDWNQIAALMSSPAVPRQARRYEASTIIPGLRPPRSGDQLPTWPDRFYLTSFSVPTFEIEPGQPNLPYPTQVYYDISTSSMLTRMQTPDGWFEDCILDGSSTHVVLRSPDLSQHKCLATVPVGLPYTDWATRDHGQILAAIDENPSLSPGRTTLLFQLPSDQGRVFWAWYTSTGVPVMFLEIPQCCNVQLVLTDYFDWVTSPGPFDPNLFVVPSDCLQAAAGA